MNPPLVYRDRRNYLDSRYCPFCGGYILSDRMNDHLLGCHARKEYLYGRQTANDEQATLARYVMMFADKERDV